MVIAYEGRREWGMRLAKASGSREWAGKNGCRAGASMLRVDQL